MSVLPVTTGARTGLPASDVRYYDNYLIQKRETLNNIYK